MRYVMVLFVVCFFFLGCASVEQCFQNEAPAKARYEPSNDSLKEQLRLDLRSGKVSKNSTLDSIRTAYGDADDMLVTGCTVRLIYRLPGGKNVTLWFEDAKHLTMWSA